jgi:hypothetical protein
VHVILTVNDTVVCGIPLYRLQDTYLFIFSTQRFWLNYVIINEDYLPVELCR